MNKKPKRSTFRVRLEEMIDSLSGDILHGRLQPGDFLPSELTLAEQFRLSKNSVRKGLDELLRRGMIEKAPRIGTRVVGVGNAGKLTLRCGYYRTLTLEANLFELIERFRQRHPHIEVRMIPLSDPVHSPDLQEVIEQGELDLVTVNVQHYELCMETRDVRDVFVPLEPRDHIYPFLLQPFQKENALYVQPLVFSPIVLCYNKAHFREAGLPVPDSSWRWSDAREAALKLARNKDRMGIFYHIQSMNRWPMFMLQNQVVFERDRQGKLSLDNEPFREAVRLSAELFEGMNAGNLYMSENDADCVMYFQQQKASMIMASYFNLNQLRQPGLEYDIAPLPYSREARTKLLVIGLAVSKLSKHQEAARSLVDFLISDEAQLHIRQHSLSIPGSRTMAEWTGKEALAHPSRFLMYRDIVPTFRFYSDMNVTYRELDTIKNGLKLYWARLDRLETVLQRLQEELGAAEPQLPLRR